jgi:hypothetical protein
LALKASRASALFPRPVPSRSPAELKTAIESMSRVRALELPPDSAGGRTLFHRGELGADLASRVDRDGKVTRHELFLFDEYLLWTPKGGFRTGVAPHGAIDLLAARGDGPASGITFDADPQISAQKVDLVAEAIGDLTTGDSLLQHLRQALILGADGRPFDANLIVTRTEHTVTLEQLRAEAEESQRRELQRRRKAQNAVLFIFMAMLALSFGSIALWIITR